MTKTDGRWQSLWRVLLVWLSLLGAGLAQPVMAQMLPQAAPVRIDHLPPDLLGPQHLLYLQEGAAPLTLAQARLAFAAGQFKPIRREVANFGVAARPVWMRLALQNDLDDGLALHLGIGMSWLDRIEVFQVQNNRVFNSWVSGDEAGPHDGAAAVVPGQGYGFALWVPAGASEVFVRVASVDAMVLPVSLQVESDARHDQTRLQYGYGFLYGYLFALVAYNAMVFFGLRRGSYLWYAVYLLSFVALNVAYTGHGYALLWPDAAYVQRYVTVFCMVLYPTLGLCFSMHFLGLRRHAPRAWATLVGFVMLVLLSITASVELNLQALANYVAFATVLLSTALMVALGIWAEVRKIRASRYFLAAALAGLAGCGVSTAQVLDWMPLNVMTFHGIEIGMMLQATLLALALARDMRSLQEARDAAKHLAHIDTLTGLLNRRALFERSQAMWSVAQRRMRPLSVMMIDIDHFKKVNDEHGHAAGDLVLRAVADVLVKTCRSADLISRWGGEEFLLFLPETAQLEAHRLAGRLRKALAVSSVEAGKTRIVVTASFGVAERHDHSTLDQLISEADHWLYEAKHQGRNRVVGPPLVDFPELARSSQLDEPEHAE